MQSNVNVWLNSNDQVKIFS